MSVSMALVDYIPVAMFLVSAILLQRDFYEMMSKGAFALFSTGTIMVVTAGAYKATWKLLYGAGICNFEKLSQSMLPMQATGFFLAAAALIALLCFPHQGKKTTALSVAAVPALYSGTMIFVSMMCLGVAVICGTLCIMAVKLKKKWTIVLFVLAFVGMLGMGYLSTKDFAIPAMNWLAECVNIFGQGMLLLGVIILHKAGLGKLQLVKD